MHADLQIERKVDTLLDRIVDSQSESVVAAYEKRIRDLETQKALMRERIANCGKPLKSFGETYRTAFDFLANPWQLWNSPRIEDRRAVLKLVFADKLIYLRGEGYRTAQISMPFKMIGGINMTKNEMVRAAGLEPAQALRPDGFSYHFDFRRPGGTFVPLRVRGLDYPFTLAFAGEGEAVGAARLVSTPSRPAVRRDELGSGLPAWRRFPRIWAVLPRMFPLGHS